VCTTHASRRPPSPRPRMTIANIILRMPGLRGDCMDVRYKGAHIPSSILRYTGFLDPRSSSKEAIGHRTAPPPLTLFFDPPPPFDL